ncbi:EpsG family protein [Undibacterium oligocarboniphilum]|uniref:EpsG family protein n=1 Tax=Undibacterium oligocarboniphilum TaxID=666702 RepID=A0A850QCE3_9BURK|nr:EpsG family protein [Undibacterium oligocarboniphilum]MBC3868949.1 EpsG family protein [Undibacterium oligocarboniphilum]NVO76929.1 EpsG family protein [Undibacterium oligocarboniphilum]
MNSKFKVLEWLLFLILATSFASLLASRPIPSIDNPSDTGRYVHYLHQYCNDYIDEQNEDKELSFKLFYSFSIGACGTQLDWLFLFQVAMLLPLFFLLFSKWRNGTFLWACAIMFSMFGLELMTNAMRQCFGTLLFFGAIANLRKNKFFAFVFAALAVVAHNSTLTYSPLLLWLLNFNFPKKALKLVILLIFLIGGFFYELFYNEMIDFINVAMDVSKFYGTIYVNELSLSFILYITLPLYWIYVVRYFRDKEYITNEENKSIIFSSILLFLCYLFFPAITYRYAIFAVVLQLFLVTRSERQGVISACYVLIPLLAHLFFMFFMSNNYQVLIYG